MKKVREIIIVEGRYDKNTVAQSVNATIIETSGFGVFSDSDKVMLLRRLAEKNGLIILTDSDKAGFFIRGRLQGMLNGADIKHAYIPDVDGREKRKPSSSKEGKLGVEGMSPEVINMALQRAGATFEDVSPGLSILPSITKTDMYAAGLSGGPYSSQRRAELLQRLGLPKRLSANGLLDVLNALFTREEFLAWFDDLL